MDIYDPQTLGIMVFGGFMVISALGIALVSTFSMKETSYEEALAKQRRELGKIQSARTEKKKKDKTSEKKSRGKKKEENPNGKIPEPDTNEDTADVNVVTEPVAAPVVATAPSPALESAPAFEVGPTATPEPANTQLKAVAEPSPAVTDPSPAPSPKEKKKKKLGKIEPASIQPLLVSAPAPVKSSTVSASAQAPKTAPLSASAPAKASPAPTKSTPASVKSAPSNAPASAKSAPASAKSAPSTAPASAKSAAASAKSAASIAPAAAKSAPASAKSAPSIAPTAAKSAPPVAKSAPVPAKAASVQAKSSPSLSKSAPVLEVITKDVPVMAVPPVGSQQITAVGTKAQEPKKKASKKKNDTVAVDSADAPLYLPYKVLVSTISSMVFSEGQAHKLIEMLSEKAGIIQDTWHKATQKGDPVAMMKKQLEEKEKQLAAEQEDSSAAKNRLRDLTKELTAEKSKVTSVETRLSSQLSKREQEMIALQARMQASYQDHVAQTQKLNAKILTLQDQLEKGPNAQLARIQQENSILRDALNQATSQAESKQNAELAKLRQECTKLTKELGEKTDGLLADERIRKGLEAKFSASEKQISLLLANHTESELALQKKLEEVCEDLRTIQSKNTNLQDTLNKSQQDNGTLAEFQVRIGKLEAEIRDSSAQVDALTAQLEETQTEKSQLVQQVASINSLLEASQSKKEEGNNEQVNAADLELLRLSLQEKENQLNTLHEELKQLQMKQETAEKTIAEQDQRNKSEDTSLITSLQDELKNLKEEMVQLKNTPSDTSAELELLQSSLSEKDNLVTSVQEELREAREKATLDGGVMVQLTEALQTLFPLIPIETEQPNWSQVFTQKAQEALSQQSQESQSSKASPEHLEKLKEAEESHGVLQAECDQYRTVLAETEGMLKHLQKSVEEEELVWKSKMANSEEQQRVALEKVQKLETENQSIQQLKEQMMLLEAQLEKQSDNRESAEEMEQLKLQLSGSQSQLELAQKEAQAHKEELAQVREQLGEITMRGQREQNGPTQAHPSQVHHQLSQTTEKLHGEADQRQQLSEEFEQAQTTITELQAQLDLLKDSAESPQGDTEDSSQLKERLEKEKKLSKDLGQAATKLQQLLKATQEQLTKERDTVRTLQEHLDGKGEFVELKEGTSV